MVVYDTLVEDVVYHVSFVFKSFPILMLILLYYFEQISTIFIYLACFLNSQDISKERHLSLTKSGISTSMSGRDATKTTFSSPCMSEDFVSAGILHTV